MLTLGLHPRVNINLRNRLRTWGKISTIVFLSQETIREKALHLDRLFHREWSRKRCAEGTYPLWSDMHCNLGTIKARPRSVVRTSNHAQYAVNRKYGVA